MRGMNGQFVYISNPHIGAPMTKHVQCICQTAKKTWNKLSKVRRAPTFFPSHPPNAICCPTPDNLKTPPQKKRHAPQENFKFFLAKWMRRELICLYQWLRNKVGGVCKYKFQICFFLQFKNRLIDWMERFFSMFLNVLLLAGKLIVFFDH